MGTRILLVVSVLPVLFLANYIYKKDINKEPKEFLAKLFGSGVASCFITLIISTILAFIFPLFREEVRFLNDYELFIYVFFYIALVEEFSKWIMAYTLSYNDQRFDELYDMIIYCTFVLLGFACLENILYVFSNGITTGLVRAVLAVPGHTCFGVYMGYFLGKSKLEKNNKKLNVILSIFVPMILHGIYDYCLFLEETASLIFFIAFIIIMYIITIKKIKKVAKQSKTKEETIDHEIYCPNCGIKYIDQYCSQCGRKRN